MWDEKDLALALAPLYLSDNAPIETLPEGFGIIRERWWVKCLYQKDYPCRKDLVVSLDIARIRKFSNMGMSNREIERITGYGRNRIAKALRK